MKNTKYIYNSKLRQITLIVCLFMLMSTPLFAQDIDPVKYVEVNVSLDTNYLLVGQQTKVSIELTQHKDLNIQWPIIEDTLGEFVEVIEVSDIDTITLDDNDYITLNQELIITSFDSGHYIIPPFNFLYQTNPMIGNEILSSDGMFLTVNNVKVDFEKEIKDIKPILEEPLTFKEILPYILAFFGIMLLIGLIIYIIIRLKNKKPIIPIPRRPQVPAHITALSKLDNLNQKKLWQSGSIKAFYSELTDISREYMEGRMHFDALEMVSEDILHELEKQDIEKELISETRAVLQDADLAKFAKLMPMADQNDRAMKWAFRFVEATMPKPVSVEPGKTDKL